jgi:hypothetical protein
MLAKHLRELARHRIRPKKIMIQSSIGIHPLRRIQCQQLIQQIASVRILNIRFQAFCKINFNWSAEEKRSETNKANLSLFVFVL